MWLAFRSVLTAVILAMPSVAVAGQFEDGLTAYEHRHYARALQFWGPLADQGDAAAENAIGVMYAYGLGVWQDFSEALKWYRLAADQGLPQAGVNIGLMYRDGRGVSHNNAEALKWLHKTAEQGFTGAQVELGVMYRDGHGVPQDYIEAAQWFRRAADQGDAIAQLNLGALYANGQGVPQDYVHAHMWSNLAASRAEYASTRYLAAKDRDLDLDYMSSAQIVEALRLAREWKPIEVPRPQVQVDNPPAQGTGVLAPGQPLAPVASTATAAKKQP